MIPLIRVELPDGEGVFLTSTIGGATTNTKNKKQTDVYTDTFPNGITVDMPLEEFYALWFTSVVTELSIVEKTFEMH